MFKLTDAGVYVEQDTVTWQNYRAIELAIEYGFTVDTAQYEILVALLRANAVDDEADEWFYIISKEALEYLQEISYPGMSWEWFDGELTLAADFVDDYEIVGKWFIDDIAELYGATLAEFQVYVKEYGYTVIYDPDDVELVRVEKNVVE